MKYSRSLAWIASTSLLMAVVVAPVSSLAASSSDFTATQTVANVVVGADLTQAIATTSTTANVAETKATRTLTVVSVPANAVTLTIGTCVVTFNTGATPDSGCANATAAIDTTANNTAALVATALRGLTGVTDSAHGALTSGGGSGVTAIFTTTGTETSASSINAILSSGSAITLNTVDTAGVVPVAQVWRITPSGTIEAGDIFTSVINGTTVSFTATSSALADATYGIATAINANSPVAAAVTAVNQGTRVDVTSDAAGTPFTATVSATNRPAVAQTVTFTPNTVGNYNYTITLNNTSHVVRGNASAQDIVEEFVSDFNGNTVATCSEDNIKVTCVALTPGTPFTYDVDIASPGGSSSGGGGGSSHHSSGGGSSSSSSTNTVTVTTPVNTTTTTTTTVIPTTPATFVRDLEAGVSGADVMALQVYLNNHGYMVAMTGPGSKGSETMLFGALTKAALMKLQTAAGITPVAGYFGPKTRAYIAAH